MKIRKRLVAIFSAAYILSGSFPVSAMEESLPEGITDNPSQSEITTVSGNGTESATEDEAVNMPQQETDCTPEEEPGERPESGLISETTPEELEETALSEISIEPEELLVSETALAPEEGTDYPVPDEAPPFRAHIEYWAGAYVLIGTFTDFTPDIILVETLYSLDEENWKAVTGGQWHLTGLGTDDSDKLYGLQNQGCIYNAYEPMRSYTTGDIERFYVKLRITKENGVSYESQPATIERGGLQPIPEGTRLGALFPSAIRVRESDPTSPYRVRMYARYQFTVSADATAEEISALLPDTLPVEVQLENGANFIATSVVDCPVTWKPLSLPQLSPGESITVPDAAEEILVPAGTLLPTPFGIFRLDEPLGLDSPPFTDEVRLILNVSPEDRNPSGVLREDRDGLKIALHQKPTGAVSIETYVLTEGESKWTELPGLSLLKEFVQPSTASSGYALVLRTDQEPYQSYVAARKEGTVPKPFFVGLKVEGGIYDGKQLILAWPDIYDELPDLPKVGRSEGNELNAGAGNKENSTESGQRPNLPQATDDRQKEPQQAATVQSDGSGTNQSTEATYATGTVSTMSGNQSTASAKENGSDHQSDLLENPSMSGQRPNLPQMAAESPGISAMNQENGPDSALLVVQAAESIKDGESHAMQAESGIENGGSALAVSDRKASMEPTTEGNSRTPIVITTVIAAACCVGAIAGKVTGYSLLRRLTRKIRCMPHREIP